jgi:hypothetical protein
MARLRLLLALRRVTLISLLSLMLSVFSVNTMKLRKVNS